jgi:hypothetical protein
MNYTEICINHNEKTKAAITLDEFTIMIKTKEIMLCFPRYHFPRALNMGERVDLCNVGLW